MNECYPLPKALLERMIDDAAKRAGIEADAVQVVLAQAVTWPDGGLGCPEPGMLYTQQLVEGYWVQLEVDGQRFDYRATSRGHFRRCKGNGALPGMPSQAI